MAEKEKINYISLQQATKYCNYSQEYLSLRVRQGKLKAIKIGRNWVTKKEWLDKYLLKTNNRNNKRNLGGTKKIKIEVVDLSVTKKEPEKGKLKKEVLPPENLPIGQFSLPIQNLLAQPKEETPSLRFGFAFASVCILLFFATVFGKTALLDVFSKTNPIVENIGEVGNVLIEDSVKDFRNTLGRDNPRGASPSSY